VLLCVCVCVCERERERERERVCATSIGRLPGNSAQEHQLQLDKGLLLEFYLQSELDLEFSSALQNYVILTRTWSEQSSHFQQSLHALLAPATSFLGSIASFHRMNAETDPGLFHVIHL
jgi:hypothetical protein